MSYTLRYHEDVRDVDIPKLDAAIKKRIKKAIETRLTQAPQDYGKPLRKTLKGYWKLRVGDYRVIFKLSDKTIVILGICHRKEIYKLILGRV